MLKQTASESLLFTRSKSDKNIGQETRRPIQLIQKMIFVRLDLKSQVKLPHTINLPRRVKEMYLLSQQPMEHGLLCIDLSLEMRVLTSVLTSVPVQCTQRQETSNKFSVLEIQKSMYGSFPHDGYHMKNNNMTFGIRYSPSKNNSKPKYSTLSVHQSLRKTNGFNDQLIINQITYRYICL